MKFVDQSQDPHDMPNDTPSPRLSIFGSLMEFVRKDTKSTMNESKSADRRANHLLTWSNGIRQLVSKKKRRHREDGFDLDLTYITPRIIAMGYPSTGNEGIYRNNAAHVTEFLGNKHGEKVKVYNLCSERDYPKEMFGGRVSKYPFDDHNPPPMPMFLPFCQNVATWLDADPENVVAIHCKAGKGRTGVMICAFLLYMQEWDSPDDCMQFYGFARTNNQKGVTIPSQRRFIRYFAELCRDDGNGCVRALCGVGDEDAKGSGEEVAEGTAEGKSLDDQPRRTRKQSIIGVDRDELKLQMERARADMASGDENETDSDDDERVVAHMESVVVLGDDTSFEGSGTVMFDENQDDVERPVLHTCKGDFRDYSAGGTLKDKLQRASIAAAVATTSGRRAGYAQASLWMTSHLDEVHHILAAAGQDIPDADEGLGIVDTGDLLLLEDSTTLQVRRGTLPRTMACFSGRVRGEVYPPKALSLIEIRLSHTPKLNVLGAFNPLFKIKCGSSRISSTEFLPNSTYRGNGPVVLAVPAITVVDEFLITLFHKTAVGKKKIGQFWLHTGFIEGKQVVLTKSDIDKINKDKKHKNYPPDFTITVHFDDVSFEVEEVDSSPGAEGGGGAGVL